MLIVLVSVLAGFVSFVAIYAWIQKRKSLPQYQTMMRVQNLTEEAVMSSRPVQQRDLTVMATRDLSTISFKDRILKPLYHTIQNFFMQLAPHAIFKTVEQHIVFAGKQDAWGVSKIIFVWGLTIVGFFFAGVMIFATSELQLVQRVMLLLITIALGVLMPVVLLKNVIRRRQERIVLQLPSFLDLLTVSVQAGLSFDASLDRIVRRMKGPLIDEFVRMQRDMRLGLSKREALQAVARRCDVEEMYLFTTSVIQAERLGTSMGKTLVDQANNMRDRYRQRIKAQALKAPIKILFPLVLFIFPTIFIIVLMPPLISVLNHLQIIPK